LTLVDPINVQQTLGEQLRAVYLHESVEISKRRKHEAPLCAVDRDVMRQAIRLPRRSLARQRRLMVAP